MMMQFSHLSSTEFEMLAADIVGTVHGVFFERFGEGVDGGIDGRVCKNNSTTWIFQAKRYKNSSSLLSKITTEKPKMDKVKPQRYFLVTSSSLSPQMKDKLKDEMSPHILSTADIYGAEDLITLLEENPNIYRKHYKLWLSSVHELSFIQHNEFYNRSAIIIDRLLEDLKYFVSYDKLETMSNKLEKSNYLLIKGDPGSGKTITAGYLVMQYFLDERKYEFHSIRDRRLSDAVSLIKKGTKQVFILDDFLGATFLHNENMLSITEDLITLIKIAKKSNGDIKLIFTSRDYIISQMLGQIDDAAELNTLLINNTESISMLEPVFRANLVYSYFLNADITLEQKENFVKDKKYLYIIEYKNFNPRVIKEVFKDINNLSLLDDPSKIWQKSFMKLSKEAQMILYILSLVETEVSHENLRDEYEVLYYKVHNIISSSYAFDNALDELEPNFITTHIKLETLWVSIVNGSIRDFLHKELSKNKMLVNIIIDNFQYFDFGIEVFNLFNKDNRAIPLNLTQQEILLKKLVDLVENPLEKLSVGLMLDESQQKVWRKDKSLIGINISNLYQRVSNSQEASKYVAKEIENISKDDALLEKIVKINHAPTLLNLLNHFSDERKNKAYSYVIQNILDSQDARAIAEEYDKNVLFKSIVDKKKRKIIKEMEEVCEEEIQRATDEYHIQAVIEDIYSIEEVFSSFNVPSYVYIEKLEKLFHGINVDTYEGIAESNYWEASNVDSNWNLYLENLKSKIVEIDAMFIEIDY